jgi:hypothetical protein
MSVTAPTTGASVVIASLANGASLQAHFTGGISPALTALTPTLSIAAGAFINWTTQAIALNNGAPAAGQLVAWQTASNISATDSTSATTNAKGIATKTLDVGPLAPGQQVTSTACINGTSQCANFAAMGARPEFAFLEGMTGISQSLPASETPSQITLRVRDMNGNPMAGATVTLHQALYAWAPPCPPHGRCAQSNLLAAQSATATSTFDGTVSFIPASIPGTPTELIGLAATGNSSTLTIKVEQHP